MNRISNALINARRAKECKNYREAKRYYDMVKMETPENWEATFYSTYCDVIEKDISQAAKSISNCIKMVLRDIKKLNDATEQNEAIKQISTDLFDYVSSSQIEVMVSYSKHNSDVWAKTSVIGVTIGAEKNNVNVLEKMEVIASRYIVDLADMLILFGNESVSEFGKNEFTKPINIKCHETAFKMMPSQYYADKLKLVNPYSSELLKFENRGILKKFWEKQNPNDKMLIGCGGFFVIAAFLAMIIKLLTEGPSVPDPVKDGLTECQRKYYEHCVSVGLSYEVNGRMMYADGRDKNGRPLYATPEEYKRRCRESATRDGKCK